MNPHSSDEFREIAERFIILRCLVGSGVHGTAVEGQDDRDEMGICIEPPEYVVGLRRFEQYIYRTQPEGERSGPAISTSSSTRCANGCDSPWAATPRCCSRCSSPATTSSCATNWVTSSARVRRRHRQPGGRAALHRVPARPARPAARHPRRPAHEPPRARRAVRVRHQVRDAHGPAGSPGRGALETGRICLPIAEPWLTWLRDLRGASTRRRKRSRPRRARARLETPRASPLRAHPDMDAMTAGSSALTAGCGTRPNGLRGLKASPTFCSDAQTLSAADRGFVESFGRNVGPVWPGYGSRVSINADLAEVARIP